MNDIGDMTVLEAKRTCLTHQVAGKHCHDCRLWSSEIGRCALAEQEVDGPPATWNVDGLGVDNKPLHQMTLSEVKQHCIEQKNCSWNEMVGKCVFGLEEDGSPIPCKLSSADFNVLPCEWVLSNQDEEISRIQRVQHPAHYTQGDVECIDAIKAATTGLEGIEAVCTGNAIKYLWRWKRKGGIEDIEKAIWYLERLESEVKAEKWEK